MATPAPVDQIALSSRIPTFWTNQPRVWFVRLESAIASQKLADLAKYDLVITKLDEDVITQVTVLLVAPPENNKYEALKTRLLSVYEESANRQIQKLIGEMELGDQKPSQLLRRMRDLAREKVPDETLTFLWQSHLPNSVKTVLRVTDSKSLDVLVAVADKVLESTSPHVNAIATSSSSSMSTDYRILYEIDKLSKRLANIERSRSRSRDQGDRFRFRSRSRSGKLSKAMQQKVDNGTYLCSYHHKFRANAKKCVQPCSWKQQGNVYIEPSQCS